MAKPAVFLDRDGTIIEEREYLADPKGVSLVPGAAAALRRLADLDYLLIIVTNQGGIARGLYSEAQFRAVQDQLEATLRDYGVRIDAVYHCPHHPDFTGPCECRKPGIGMHQQASRELGIDLARSWYIGDKLTDVAPASVLGGRGILVRTGYGAESEPKAAPETVVLDDLAAAAEFIAER